EIDLRIALAGVLDDLLDHAVRHVVAARGLNLALERRVLLDREAIVARALAIEAGFEDRLQAPLDDLGACGDCADVALLLHLPVYEGFDAGMVGVADDHLRRPARRAAGLDRARRPIADLQEGHKAGRAATARQLLVLAAQKREVRAGAGAIFE